MMEAAWLDRRPLVVAVAGPNGAGKSTFFWAHLAASGLPWVNADLLARTRQLAPYAAAELADRLRRELLDRRGSFVFETVFSDRTGEKLAWLEHAAEAGYEVALCFIGISSPEVSRQRVAMRVAQGEHDVPDEKLRARFPRTLANLRRAIPRLPHVLVFDIDDLAQPFRRVAVFEQGRLTLCRPPIPAWLLPLLPDHARDG